MKNATQHWALASILHVLNRRLLFKTNSSSENANHHPSFLRFWNWAEENWSMQPKLCAQKMLLKQKPNPANIRKWIARFYYFRHLYSAGSACVLLTIIA